MEELPKLERKKFGFADKAKNGGVIFINDDLTQVFSKLLLEEFTRAFNLGYTIEEIAEVYNLDPDEVLLALFHQARRGKTTRPLGFRFKNKKGGK